MGGLIILHPLGATKERNFKREMVRAGHITIRGRDFPQMQLITVEELIEGERFDTPPCWDASRRRSSSSSSRRSDLNPKES